MTNTPMTFEQWFEAHRKSEWVSESPMPKTFLIWDRDNLRKGWEASQAQQAQVIAELVEALEALLEANKVTHRTQPPETVMQAEAQLDKIRFAVTNANALIAKVKGK